MTYYYKNKHIWTAAPFENVKSVRKINEKFSLTLIFTETKTTKKITKFIAKIILQMQQQQQQLPKKNYHIGVKPNLKQNQQ